MHSLVRASVKQSTSSTELSSWTDAESVSTAPAPACSERNSTYSSGPVDHAPAASSGEVSAGAQGVARVRRRGRAPPGGAAASSDRLEVRRPGWAKVSRRREAHEHVLRGGQPGVRPHRQLQRRCAPAARRPPGTVLPARRTRLVSTPSALELLVGELAVGVQAGRELVDRDPVDLALGGAITASQARAESRPPGRRREPPPARRPSPPRRRPPSARRRGRSGLERDDDGPREVTGAGQRHGA